MKIAVVGAGAMGSLFAGYLAKHKLDVWAYDVWQEHIAAIKKNGLRMTRTNDSDLHRTSFLNERKPLKIISTEFYIKLLMVVYIL